MSDIPLNARLKTYSATASAWSAANPILLSGEQGFDTTNRRFKIGDGVTAWSSLAYVPTAKTFSVTIPTGSWSSSSSGGVTYYYKSITVSGITSSDTPVVDVVLSATVSTARTQLEEWTKVSRITTGTNIITVYCYEEVPTLSLSIQLKVTF